MIRRGDALDYTYTERKPLIEVVFLFESAKMAATRLAARNMFQLIGFSDEASVTLVDDEGLETSEDFAYLTDDRVRSIVKAIRRPGGAADGATVSERAQHHFMLAAKLIQYWIRTKRSIDFTLIQLNMFPEIERQSLLEVGWKNSDYEPQDY